MKRVNKVLPATPLLSALAIIASLLFGSLQPTFADAYSEAQVKASLIADTAFVQSGTPFKLAVELKMSPGWHTYYKEPGDSGMPTQIEWQLPEGFKAGELEWPEPEKFEESGMVTTGYKDMTVIGAEISPPDDLKPGRDLTFKAKVKWLACREVCVPGSADVSLKLAVGASNQPPEPANFDKFSLLRGEEAPIEKAASILDQDLKIEGAGRKKLGLLAYLGLALIGGFILNFMPCVLPVISLKVIGFMEQAGEAPKQVFLLGLSFAAGIVGSTLALGVLVVAIQSAGQNIGWGFQFQNPAFVIAMSVIVLLLALSMFGLFYLQVTFGQSEIDQMAAREGISGSFFKGVLATVLATPCSAPFLGTAVGFAFTQSPWVILSIFFAVGIGMAAPYIFLTANPGWMKHIPKPGDWMETFKQAMGFLLIATVVWLLWILGNQVGLDGAIMTTAFLVCISFAAWLVGRLIDLTSTNRKKIIVWSAALLVTGAGFYEFILPLPGIAGKPLPEIAASTSFPEDGGEISWQPFSDESLNKELSEGKTVFLDFTADWCLTCKANEKAVINTKAVRSKFEALGVVTMKADWTTQNPEITNLLRKFGRSGVPLYVIFPGKNPTEPIVLPEVITKAMLLDKLDKAGGSISL